MPEYVDKEKAIDLFYSIDPENDGRMYDCFSI